MSHTGIETTLVPPRHFAPASSMPGVEVRTARRRTPTVMLAVMAVTDDALLAALRGPDRYAAVA
jgi:hypothetical protein